MRHEKFYCFFFVFFLFFIFFSFILYFQVKGHQRVLSDSKEFHEVTKRDAQKQLEMELDILLDTVKEDDRKKALQKEMGRFSTLFGRFLQEDGPSVEWENIQKLPTDAVKDYSSLQSPSEDTVSIY